MGNWCPMKRRLTSKHTKRSSSKRIPRTSSEGPALHIWSLRQLLWVKWSSDGFNIPSVQQAEKLLVLHKIFPNTFRSWNSLLHSTIMTVLYPTLKLDSLILHIVRSSSSNAEMTDETTSFNLLMSVQRPLWNRKFQARRSVSHDVRVSCWAKTNSN